MHVYCAIYIHDMFEINSNIFHFGKYAGVTVLLFLNQILEVFLLKHANSSVIITFVKMTVIEFFFFC